MRHTLRVALLLVLLSAHACQSPPRARAGETSTPKQSADGMIALPATGWHECELTLE